MLPDSVLQLAEAVVAKYRLKNRKLTVAESCTGGLLGSAITFCAGASEAFERGFITYSNEAKTEMLGVPQALIRTHGAVSEECASSMALQARQIARVDVGVSITGIAGPGGGSENKPVGLVYIGLADAKSVAVKKFNFTGGRKDIRSGAVAEALALLMQAADKF